MTTEQQPPEPQEHRRSRWWPFDGVPRIGRYQLEEPTETDGSGAEAGLGPTDPSEAPGNGSVIEGEVVTDDQRAARELEQKREQAVAERLPLPPTFRQELRMQLADFAERAHQKRLNPSGPEMLGSGGGITEAVVRAMAEVIPPQNLPGAARSEEDRADLLLGALAATDPKRVAEAGHVSFVTLRGRLMLDVSTAAIDGESLVTRFVRLPNRSESPDRDAAGQDAAGQDAAGQNVAGQNAAGRDAAGQDAAGDNAAGDNAAGDNAAGDNAAGDNAAGDNAAGDKAAGQDAADQNAPNQEPAGSRDDPERPARYAAVICGPAAVIAGGRPFLGMDALTTYARRQAFRSVSDDTGPHGARSGMRAAHGIEIVVLLDPSLGGGVWVDVDPATGLPAAVMSIAVRSAGFRFTPLTAA
jgi:hypothetical protein